MNLERFENGCLRENVINFMIYIINKPLHFLCSIGGPLSVFALLFIKYNTLFYNFFLRRNNNFLFKVQGTLRRTEKVSMKISMYIFYSALPETAFTSHFYKKEL